MSPAKDASVIPAGLYCYEYTGVMRRGRLQTRTCPYWRVIEGQPEQANGYCDYLERGDFDDGTFLLWDQVKECGINRDD